MPEQNKLCNVAWISAAMIGTLIMTGCNSEAMSPPEKRSFRRRFLEHQRELG
jgi:hypothetical protein